MKWRMLLLKRSSIHFHQTLSNSSYSTTTTTPDLLYYGSLIQRCSDSSLLRQGQLLHARLITHHSVTPLHSFLASKLISLYARFNLLHDARFLFHQIPQPNLFAFNSLLLAHSLHPSHTITLFRIHFRSRNCNHSLFRPDSFTLSVLLKSLSHVDCYLTTVKSVHCFAIRTLSVPDVFVYNGLISIYANHSCLAYARKVFDVMPVRDVVSWNSILSGYARSGCNNYYKDCLVLFNSMKLDGVVRPNSVTVLCLLQACGQFGDLVNGMEVHRYAVENGVPMDCAVWNSIISLYAKCGSLEYARRVFDEMRGKDDVSYGSMISGYFSYGFVEKAMRLFREKDRYALSVWNVMVSGFVQNNCYDTAVELIHEMQDSGVRPNSVTLSSVLPAISYFSNFLGGKQVHAYAIRNDYDRNVYVASALVDVYAKAGFLRESRRVFEMTKVPSIILWTAIMSAYAAHGDADAALLLFNEMLRNQIKPDPVTFTAVLSACAHAGLVEKARGFFHSMLSDYGISPSIEHYACMAGVFSRIGMLKEAVEFIDNMPFEPNAKIWGALLSGAAVHGDIDVGKFAFDRLFDIEPDNTGNYILMANLYWKSGQWEEANLVRDKMKRIGYTKIPGCSWIETTEGLQVFVAQDVLNKQYAEAYGVLKELFILMRAEGYAMISELDEESDSYSQLKEETPPACLDPKGVTFAS